jgi:acyl-CoA synthetase (AMP-forming)/AMP-acid ligase II
MNADNPELVRAALDAGIVHFDTAHYYQRGRNEEMIGQMIKGRPRDSFVIATKVLGSPIDSKTGLYKPEATEEVFRGGWYHTGDAGYLDDNGYLFLVDRVKDMIVTGGENVYSAEVESAISKHEAVAQVAVIGIPHETWGEQVHAIVVLVDGATVTEEEIQVFTREVIAGYKVPKSDEFRTEPLPLSGAMKVLKKDLRAPYWEGQERAVN